ncbi:hypothetical protein MIR68_001360 [Amoeboaphelidium protococcarum]|nr:hypothetical protein MIR68_001360 [Amoeboaphelidium protococcarum]
MRHRSDSKRPANNTVRTRRYQEQAKARNSPGSAKVLKQTLNDGVNDNQGQMMQVSSPQKNVKQKHVRQKTPPADGVHGFMFTSPARIHKKSSLAGAPLQQSQPEQSRASSRKLNFNTQKQSSKPQVVLKEVEVSEAAEYSTPEVNMTAAVNDTIVEETQKNDETENRALFSPYITQHKHKYQTRSVTRKIRVDTRPVSKSGSIISLDQHALHQQDGDKSFDQSYEVMSIEDKENPANDQVLSISFHEHIELSDQLDTSDLVGEEAIESFLLVQSINSDPKSSDHLPFTQHALPPLQEDKLTLVLDLDETLVHCSTERSKFQSFDHHFTVDFQNRTFDVFAKQRPFVLDFLDHVSELYEVVIFTASQQIYADKILNLLDKNKKWTKFRLFRNSCVHIDGTFIKDLRILGRDLSKVIIVDNAIEAFTFQVNNGVPIKSWFDDDNDRELEKLKHMLTKIAQIHQQQLLQDPRKQLQQQRHQCFNVTDILKQQFCMEERIAKIKAEYDEEPRFGFGDDNDDEL